MKEGLTVFIKYATVLKLITPIVLFALWWIGSIMLSVDPDKTLSLVPISLGMMTAVTIVIQLVVHGWEKE
ncbi:MAG: hypothetical protein ACFFCW_36125 [Candidatus Hodarchaeota archaeon]